VQFHYDIDSGVAIHFQHIEADIYQPRSRGDNMFGSVRVCACVRPFVRVRVCVSV